MVDAVVKDGQIVESASQSSVKQAKSKTGVDKDAFLQLLVAQMKYQDPLEPTSNSFPRWNRCRTWRRPWSLQELLPW